MKNKVLPDFLSHILTISYLFNKGIFLKRKSNIKSAINIKKHKDTQYPYVFYKKLVIITLSTQTLHQKQNPVHYANSTL